MSIVLPERGILDKSFGSIDDLSQELFAEHPEAAFWVGKVANFGTILLPDAHSALHRFRGDVYSGELGWISPSALDDQGREFDEYEDTSVELGVVQNASAEVGVSRVVGSMRLIRKTAPTDLYPIEHYFPEAFSSPIGTDSAEVSRFIARHPDRFTQRIVSLSLIRAAALHATTEGIPDYYCIIEKPLQRLLGKIGVPMEQMAPEKDIPEQGGVLFPIKIDALKIADGVRASDPLLDEFFRHDIPNRGTGYYSTELIKGEL